MITGKKSNTKSVDDLLTVRITPAQKAKLRRISVMLWPDLPFSVRKVLKVVIDSYKV
jgi:hypothetical protein